MTRLTAIMNAALARREDLLAQLQNENTDCYRLFLGSNEGQAGLTIDRYGEQLLIQTFHEPLTEAQVEEIVAVAGDHFAIGEVVYNDRSAPNSRRRDAQVTDSPAGVCHEGGVTYRIRGKHSGQDPLLFLDLRMVRRYIQAQAAGKTVLNLFAYTCGVGVCAAVGGATEVWNIDFAASSLGVGRENAQLNGIPSSKISFLQSDFFSATRQLAGLPVKQRHVKGQKPHGYMRLEPRQFDIVCLDPPRWAKSQFGTVDLIRDYPSLMKPAVLATQPGGTLICTNNVAQVEIEGWLETLERCAAKAGRPLQALEVLEPDSDFPTRDGRHPLKVAVLKV
jgi:23S rRNA (cytosine1962-C5)-methyltransferase